MKDLTSTRTPQIIAAEINAINRESRKMLLINAIEVGRRLQEAKDLLQHGEWLKWLEESVEYAKSTAENLMRLYAEYGPELTADSAGGPNSQPVGSLTYTQALLLLGLPQEERAEFVAQNDVGKMSKRKLRQTLKGSGRVKPKGTASPPESKDPQEIPAPAKAAPSAAALPTHNLATEPDPNAIPKQVECCDNCREIIAKTFFELAKALTNLAAMDPKIKEEKRKEAEMLLNALAESIKVWPPIPKPLIVTSGPCKR